MSLTTDQWEDVTAHIRELSNMYDAGWPQGHSGFRRVVRDIVTGLRERSAPTRRHVLTRQDWIDIWNYMLTLEHIYHEGWIPPHCIYRNAVERIIADMKWKVQSTVGQLE